MLESFHSKKDDVIASLRDLAKFAENLGARSLTAGPADSWTTSTRRRPGRP